VAAIVDSLIVEKEGYVTKIVPVELYDDTVDISLDTIEEPVFLVEDEGYDCEVTSPSGSNGAFLYVFWQSQIHNGLFFLRLYGYVLPSVLPFHR
jgi:hypothetical protein